jgi:hypothetical protein
MTTQSNFSDSTSTPIPTPAPTPAPAPAPAPNASAGVISAAQQYGVDTSSIIGVGGGTYVPDSWMRTTPDGSYVQQPATLGALTPAQSSSMWASMLGDEWDQYQNGQTKNPDGTYSTSDATGNNQSWMQTLGLTGTGTGGSGTGGGTGGGTGTGGSGTGGTTTGPGGVTYVQAPGMGVVQQVQAGTYNAAQMDAATYDGAGSQAEIHGWTVDPRTQTVQGQLDSIIAKDSPLMQRAAALGEMTANERGLINSSMAAGAAQTAVLDAATPIASADATMYGRAASQNASEANTTARFNADQSGQTGRFNTSQINASREFNANSQNQASQFNTELGFKSQLANQDVQLRTTLAQYDGQLRAAIANADASNKLQLTELDIQARTDITNLEGKWRLQIQSTASAGDAYRQMINSIGSVITDPNMDAGAKQAAINQLGGMFNDYMELQSHMSGLDLGDILVFDTTAAAPAPAPGGTGIEALPPALRSSYEAYRNSGGTLNPEEWYRITYGVENPGPGNDGPGPSSTSGTSGVGDAAASGVSGGGY